MDPEEAVMVYARASAYNDKSLAKAMLPKAARVPLHLIPAQVRQEIPADALERLVSCFLISARARQQNLS